MHLIPLYKINLIFQMEHEAIKKLPPLLFEIAFYFIIQFNLLLES